MKKMRSQKRKIFSKEKKYAENDDDGDENFTAKIYEGNSGRR